MLQGCRFVRNSLIKSFDRFEQGIRDLGDGGDIESLKQSISKTVDASRNELKKAVNELDATVGIRSDKKALDAIIQLGKNLTKIKFSVIDQI